jgi:hypothetical protein
MQIYNVIMQRNKLCEHMAMGSNPVRGRILFFVSHPGAMLLFYIRPKQSITTTKVVYFSNMLPYIIPRPYIKWH